MHDAFAENESGSQRLPAISQSSTQGEAQTAAPGIRALLQQEPLGAEFTKVLVDNLPDLYAKDAQPSPAGATTDLQEFLREVVDCFAVELHAPHITAKAQRLFARHAATELAQGGGEREALGDEQIEAAWERAWAQHPSSQCSALNGSFHRLPMLKHFARALLAGASPEVTRPIEERLTPDEAKHLLAIRDYIDRQEDDNAASALVHLFDHELTKIYPFAALEARSAMTPTQPPTEEKR